MHGCNTACHLSTGVKSPPSKSFRTVVKPGEMLMGFKSKCVPRLPWGAGGTRANIPEHSTVREPSNLWWGNPPAFFWAQRGRVGAALASRVSRNTNVRPLLGTARNTGSPAFPAPPSGNLIRPAEMRSLNAGTKNLLSVSEEAHSS